ncbi:universal stress protein [Actinomycetospora rhizophila]|uniref:Universal stress protein n=1 Tax=Actinomycetospora rhizophila TaxID=1416876 RepID=A0ABV9ZIC9_9PSEU
MDVAGGVLDHRATAVVPDDGVVAGARYRPERFVVGVDGSLGVLAAVSWAAGEAAATGATLHLVHATPGTLPADEPDGGARGRAWLRRALRAAAAVAPDAAITVAQLEGPPGRALAAVSRSTDRVVLGGRRRRDVDDRHGDATVARLLTDARCPVIVVPPSRTGSWASTPSPRPVLAALRGTVDDRRTLELAGEAARRRRVALVAAIGAPPARRHAAIAHAQRAGARRLEVGDDLLAGLRHLGQRSQLLVVGAPDPDAGWSDEELAALLRHRTCAAMVVPAR